MKFHGSFGGPQTLITSVVIKCNEFGEPDTVSIIDRYKILRELKLTVTVPGCSKIR